MIRIIAIHKAVVAAHVAGAGLEAEDADAAQQNQMLRARQLSQLQLLQLQVALTRHRIRIQATPVVHRKNNNPIYRHPGIDSVGCCRCEGNS